MSETKQESPTQQATPAPTDALNMLELLLKDPLVLAAAATKMGISGAGGKKLSEGQGKPHVEAYKQFKQSTRLIAAYREVTKHLSCTHCGNVVTEVVRLGENESMSFVGLNGKPITVSCKWLEGHPDVYGTQSSCPKCHEFIGGLERAELERRYWLLLDTSLARKVELMNVKPE